MIEDQVNITKDGYNMQIDISGFAGFYKRLGWKIIGSAPILPVFVGLPSRGRVRPGVTEARIAELNAQRGNPFKAILSKQHHKYCSRHCALKERWITNGRL